MSGFGLAVENVYLGQGAQLQNSGPHQRPLDVAATGCAKYMRENLNETVREIIVH